MNRSRVILACLLLLVVAACGTQTATPTEVPSDVQPDTAPPTASPSVLTGTLNELNGTVNAKLSGEADFRPGSNGDILQVNDQLQTGDDGRARVDLSSGTIVRVAPSSLFTLVSNEETEQGLATRLKLELGRIYIILTGGSMEVETPSGVASVLGSYMMVEINSTTNDIQVFCAETKEICKVGDLELTEGQKATFIFDSNTGKYLPGVKEDMTEEDFKKWRDEYPEDGWLLDLVLGRRPKQETTPTEVPVPTEPPATCFSLLEPPDGASLESGMVTFSWESQVGAVEYRLVFTSPYGALNLLKSTTLSLTNYINIFPTGGTYTWEVTAFDASGAPIRTADPFTFSKPETAPLPPEKPKGDDEEKIICTYEDAQWYDSSLPCYCDEGAEILPPYCYYQGPY